MRRAAFLLLLAAAPAAAHSGTGLPGGFLAGLWHPLSGPDHLLAMVAVGLWGAFLGRPLLYLLPVIFPLMMVVGAEIGMLDVPLPPVEIGIASSLLILGAAIALAWKAPVWLACAIVGIFALFHGYAHGRELPSAAEPLGYAAGFVVATGSLHLAGIAIGGLKKRALGAGIALAGVWFLCRALV